MTSGTEIIKCKAAIQKVLSNIGKTNGTAPPTSRSSNKFPILYDFFVADTLRSATKKRYEAAKAQVCEVFGVDPETLEDGHNKIEGSTEHLDLLVKKASGSRTIDPTMLKNELTKRYGADTAATIIDASSKDKKGAVTISAVMK
jgi:hypothetical protein